MTDDVIHSTHYNIKHINIGLSWQFAAQTIEKLLG